MDWNAQIEPLTHVERQTIIDAILAFCRAHNLTDAAIAQAVDLSKASISTARNSKKPSQTTIIKLCQLFEIRFASTVAWYRWYEAYKDVIGTEPEL
jgi:DNA-binding XRE family transcriptional regulator